MPASPNDWTVERLHRIPDDGKRREIIDGELFVTPSPIPRHQYVAGRLFALLLEYCDHVGLQAVMPPADVIVSPDTLVQPDVFVVPLDSAGRPPATYEEFGRPLLVIEVLSPSTARIDRSQKLRLYQEMQVPEYWIVDVQSREIERWQTVSREAQLVRDSIVWHPVTNLTPLVIDLELLFRRVYGY